MRKDDIKNFCSKNNIIINDQELDIVFNYIQENWYEICFSDTKITLDKIKPLLKPESYLEAKKLIEEYKEKYKSYL